MESKAYLIAEDIDLMGFISTLEKSLEVMTGVPIDSIDEALPEGWRGQVVESYKQTMDEVYTKDEVVALVGFYKSECGSSAMSKLGKVEDAITPKLQALFQST